MLHEAGDRRGVVAAQEGAQDRCLPGWLTRWRICGRRLRLDSELLDKAVTWQTVGGDERTTRAWPAVGKLGKQFAP